jgi:hypothetical protein
MVIVALVVAGLVTISLILSVMVSDLKRRHANMTRQLARLELRVNTPKLR